MVVLGRREGQAALAAQAGAARFETDSRAAGAGYDLVVEAAGSTDAVLSALAAARRGGTVVLIGLPPHGATAAVPVDDVVNNDLIIRGSFSYTSAAWREVVTLLNAGLLELGFLVTHRFPLTEWEAALDTLRGDGEPARQGDADRRQRLMKRRTFQPTSRGSAPPPADPPAAASTSRCGWC